jgi:hypothetical protein
MTKDIIMREKKAPIPHERGSSTIYALFFTAAMERICSPTPEEIR